MYLLRFGVLSEGSRKLNHKEIPMSKMNARLILVGILALSLAAAGCTSKMAKGGAIGAGAGGLLGGVIGKQVGNTGKGAIIGAAVGGAAGAVIGNYMDKQAEEMKSNVQGAQVERVGEGINVTFEGGFLFATNSSDLQTTAQANVNKLADILQKYPDTNVQISGHTDATGSDSYNQKLSEQRAASVSNKLIASGVAPTRLKTVGYGESIPVASNDTPEGRAQNRRVEIAITANDTLVKAAQDGKELK